MGNYKVRVANEVEIREVQELFFELGYGFEGCIVKTVQNFEYVGEWYFFTYSDGDLTVSADESLFNFKDSHKKITLPQLRDLVVLTRNCVGDAKFIDDFGDKWFVDSDGSYWMFERKVWRPALKPSFVLKSIEKEEMKEYLEKQEDGTYNLVMRGEFCKEDDIEVPDGVEAYIELKDGTKGFYSWHTNGKCLFKGLWYNFLDDFLPRVKFVLWVGELSNNNLCACLNSEAWLKLENQKSEELPSISDEKSLNEQHAEIEKVRQKHSHYKKDISHLNVLDVYRVLELFNVTNPCIQHAVKKLLCSGQRGVKDSDRDINEAIDSLQRYNEMKIEDDNS